jgi:hypothetical protein
MAGPSDATPCHAPMLDSAAGFWVPSFVSVYEVNENNLNGLGSLTSTRKGEGLQARIARGIHGLPLESFSRAHHARPFYTL